ncbi:MAG: type II toxin-antitoxin system VapC family toxin [Candidatus Sulfotelmatobacter sp.]
MDASAILAILQNEPETVAMGKALLQAPICRISPVNYVEAAIIADNNSNPALRRKLDDLLRDASISIETITPKQAEIAREAYRDFGKGRHKAGLNLGDCFAYALAKEKGEALLFKGDDFRHTDIEAVK